MPPGEGSGLLPSPAEPTVLVREPESTVGRDEKVIREYIRRQEQEDQRLEQLKLVTE